jgi:PKHD-type hydroxylase
MRSHSTDDDLMDEMWQQWAVVAKSVGGILTADECERIIHETAEIDFGRARVLRAGKDTVTKTRTNDRAIFPRNAEHQWLYDRIRAVAESVNEELWRFEITGIDEIDILRYRLGRQFKWHYDTHRSFRRKITCVVNLSDPSTYWKGGLEIRCTHLEKKFRRNQGAATFFPSYIQHCARPPWLGTRWSLVAWLTGPEWR